MIAGGMTVTHFVSDYGESFSDVLQALLRALDSLNSNEVLAPSTFKYMHALSEQVSSDVHIAVNIDILKCF